MRVPRIRLIGATGNQLGVVTVREALDLAREAGYDLVEISPNAEPPVCRIMDFGKYQFQQNKQRAAAKRKQHVMHIKEVKFRPTIEEGDYQVKLRNLIRFLTSGDKVRCTLRYRGRELSHQELGMKIMHRLQADLTQYGIVEQEPRMEMRQLVMVLAPKKSGGQATTVSNEQVSNKVTSA